MPFVAVAGGTQLLGGILASRAAERAQKRILGIGSQAADAVDRATAGAIKAGYSGMEIANNALDQGLQGANAVLDPYSAAGVNALSGLGNLANEQFQFTQDDPSYQWRLEQGQKAIERSAAARGSALGGATLKALTGYAQGAASQEYQAAFNRFMQQRQAREGTLTTLAGIGQSAAGQQSNNIINTAGAKANVGLQGSQYVGNVGLRGAAESGNLRIGVGTNAAAGDVAQANIWNNTLSNVGNTVMDAYMWRKLSQPSQPSNPSTAQV